MGTEPTGDLTARENQAGRALEEAEKASGWAEQLVERRGMPRCATDEEASLLLVSQGSAMACRLVELGLGGCRMELRQRLPAAVPAAVEASFKINGIAFRLSGMTEWSAGGTTVGVSFGPMSSRRRDDLVEVLCEMEAAKAEKEKAEAGAKGERGLDRTIDANNAKPGTNEDGARLLLVPAAPVPAALVPAALVPAALVSPVGERRFRLRDFIFGKATEPVAPPFRDGDRIPLIGAAASEGSRLEPAHTVAAGPVLVPRPPVTVGQAGGEAAIEMASAKQAEMPPAPTGRDRRTAQRCTVDTSATIYLVKIGSRLAGQVLDLSLGGCRIRTAQKFPVGIYTRVETEFHMQGLPFRLSGVIQAVHDRHHVGIRFLDVSPRKREQVAELIREIVGTEDEGKGN